LTAYCNRTNADTYGSGHPRQQNITNAIIGDLVTGCSFPLSITENDRFRHFLTVVDSQYTPPARATIATQLERRVNAQKEERKELKEANTVNATVDIWSDR